MSASFSVSALADYPSKSANASASTERLAILFEQHAASLQSWMEQSYASNPNELKKSTQVSPREMAEWVFHGPFNWKFDAIQSLQSSDALRLSVSDDFPGDRILAFTTGTYTSLSGYFQTLHQKETSDKKPITEVMLEIRVTLNSLLQNNHNPASNITLSTAEYEAFITLLRKIESDAFKAQ
jgi:hypothetical protein